MRNSLARLEAVLTAALLLGIAAFASVESAQTQGTSQAGPVTIDFRAVTADGQAVLDLEPKDLTLKVDGRAREITSLELVQVSAGETSTETRWLPPPFASNDASAAGRDMIIVIDDESFPPGQEPLVRSAVEQLLAGMSQGDRVGLVTLPRQAVNINVTSQLGTIRQVMATLVGQAVSAESAEDAVCRSRVNLEALKNLFRGRSRDALTTVLFFSSGLMPPASTTNRPGTQPGLCEIRSQDFQDVAAAKAGSPVSFYVVQIPQDVGASSTSTNDLLAGLESLAAVVGGEHLQLTGQRANAMSRVLRETSARYRLMFEPEAGERNGGSHRVELRVGRDRVKLHAQERLTIPKADAGSGAKAGPTVSDMLRAATIRGDLPLILTGYSSRNPGSDRVKVVVLFEPLDRSAKLTSAVVGLFDAKGTLKAQGTVSGGDLSQRPAMAALIAPAGSYRLRLAAADASGRGGSVEEEIRAELNGAGPMKMGSIAFGVSQNGTFAPRLQFGDETAAIVYLEIYGVPKAGALSASIELAASENGPALLAGPAGIRPGSSDDSRIVLSTISLGALPPGDILVRAIISLDGQPAGRVSRTLRKTAR